MNVHALDLTGMRCPLPLIRLNQLVRKAEDGTAFEIQADDPAFCPDLEAWCRLTGVELVSCDREGSTTIAVVRKRAA